MKFNALVVAAMVITSVNAGLFGKATNPFKKSGGGSMSEQLYDPLENDEDIFQESEPTKNGQYDDSDDAEKTQDCNRMFTIAEKIQDNIFDLADDFRINLPIPDAPNSGANDLKPEAREGHAEFYSQIKDEQKAIKEKATFLKEKYEENWEKIVKTECPTESVRLLSPEEMMEIGIYLDKQMMTPQVQDNNDIDLMAFDRK
ncbi:hypothetical protein BASA61_005459 [Batrachochytrium salamandrivorans]|nr:hypothetical protein BASA61_005459 [Batrachochytrium salamandrivorans]KAH9253108.1 hypothetical protein BASA81_008942 [Batrachochytrium salamandrivorans]